MIIQLNYYNLEIFEFSELTSTNDFLIQQNYQNQPQLCIAKRQTKGKGQFGRIWQTQLRSALFSLKVKLPIFDITGLSLVAGISCVQILEKNYNIKNLTIKWPNDIFIDNKKLGGILIENQISNNNQFLIIGIGINILSDSFVSINQNINIKQLIMRITDNILLNLAIFQTNGFAEFTIPWQKYDFLTNNKIPISFKDTNGFATGVTKNGSLIWTDTIKQVIIHSSNQIRVLGKFS